MKRFTLPLLLLAMLAAGFLGGAYFQKQQVTEHASASLVNQEQGKPNGIDFGLFWNVWNSLQERYVDKEKLNTQEMVYGAISGLVEAVGDPYTVFLPPKESEVFNQQIEGAFGGIGIEIGVREKILTVIAPIKDSPADKAGILAGDKIVKINSLSTEGMSMDEAVSKIRGAKGTTVTLTVFSNGDDKNKDFTITRDTIKIPSLEWKLMDGDIAYIELNVFNKNADSDFKKAAKEISSSKATRIILDVRNNPGGFLDSAVYIAGFFLDRGQVVTIQKDAHGNQLVYKADGNSQLKKYPLIILANKGSASASEILAGALKDNRGILIVGEKTFGKGSVQELVGFSGGSELKVTIAKWLTPKGVSIQEHGIDADVQIELKEEEAVAGKDSQLDKAVELIKTL